MKDYGEFVEVGSVRFQRTLPGPIERVFAYLTDPELRSTWFASGALEPRVGGALTLHFRHADFAPPDEPVPERFAREPEMTMTARVTRYEPPKAVAWLWGGSEVVFELEPRGEDVLLTLTHRRLGSRDETINVSAGWHAHLEVLGLALRGEKARAFWSTIDRLEAEYAKRLPRGE